jgi:hypothetical protein
MKPDKNLFWFLKDEVELDLNKPSVLDMYVQQVISRGKMKDVKTLLMAVSPMRFQESFRRLNRFLPYEVKKFWEDFIGNINPSAKRNP